MPLVGQVALRWYIGRCVNSASNDAVELFTIEPDDWRRWAAPIVAFEREHFPADLQEDVGDLRRLVESATSIVLGARTRDLTLAGYIASDVLERLGMFRESGPIGTGISMTRST